MAEMNFVVTGFAPWGSYAPLPNLTTNTSWEIANALPRVIFRLNKPNIRIFTYPTPIKTSWETARKTAPVLWEARKADYGISVQPNTPETFHIDAMIHLGMDDGPDSPFSLEKMAYKGRFRDHDVDNKTPSEEDLAGGGSWGSCPDSLETDLDVEEIWKQVSSKVHDVKIRTSTNPGRYLCAYLYYASLAAVHVRGEMKRDLFVHVPPKNDSQDIEKGVGVISKVIEAIADQLLESSRDDIPPQI
ncbi:hypothetical protein O1611_g1159 [Lasiodiplodia mahajangana]|uniref:Uncharacterized protein n=1 Tax=Lasiodiplodia mahajangana TaxID=1108764 RepID=A0ACC2JYB8_9PEZI|nr:hypothetical protein O1611_g1159 [Lasiodiplodia mahajangana]